jgi:hypothetical protein
MVPTWVLVLLIPLGGWALGLASCAIAQCAAGNRSEVSAWWGLLGPVGWVIAALRGVQVRLP